MIKDSFPIRRTRLTGNSVFYHDSRRPGGNEGNRGAAKEKVNRSGNTILLQEINRMSDNKAILLLEDGTVFEGQSFGARHRHRRSSFQRR
jgi:hypothetical protein